MSTNQLRSFQLDKKEYPVVSQNDLGAPCCVVSPFIFPKNVETFSILSVVKSKRDPNIFFFAGKSFSLTRIGDADYFIAITGDWKW